MAKPNYSYEKRKRDLAKKKKKEEKRQRKMGVPADPPKEGPPQPPVAEDKSNG